MHTIARTTLLAAATPALALALAATLAPASSSFSSSAPRTVLDVADLAQGAPPALAWSERRSGRTVIHGTGGTTTPVVNSLDQFAPMGSGYVVQTIGNRPSTTRWIAADGTPGRREWRTGYGLAVSARGGTSSPSPARPAGLVDRPGGRPGASVQPRPDHRHGPRRHGHRRELQGERATSIGCTIYVNGRTAPGTPPPTASSTARRTCGSPRPGAAGGSAGSARWTTSGRAA